MCPECGQPLVAFELRGVEIDHCVDCGGTWLDAGELETITELAGVPSGELSRALSDASARGRGSRRCPRGDRRLRIIAVGDENAVELDRCPAGHGLWFDQGELRAVIERSHDSEEGSVAQFFADLYRTELETQPRGDG